MHFIGSVVHIDEGLGEVSLISLVHLAAMADLEHEYHQLMILDAADHAIIAYAIAPLPRSRGSVVS